jgi:hypothetical protein
LFVSWIQKVRNTIFVGAKFASLIAFFSVSGLDSPHISNSYNWMLSSLALLISSVFLYQTKSSIDRCNSAEIMILRVEKLIICFLVSQLCNRTGAVKFQPVCVRQRERERVL